MRAFSAPSLILFPSGSFSSYVLVSLGSDFGALIDNLKLIRYDVVPDFG
ncbi:hypothetical protein L195_g048492, partial [Trifolium pratense]